MSTNFLRSARTALTAMLLMVSASPLYAIDGKYRFFAYGMGQRSCEEYVKFREKRLDTLNQLHKRYTKEELYEIVDKIVEHWIAGFLTAHNLYVSDTFDVAAGSKMDELQMRLEKNCRGNGKQYLAEAMIALVQELHSQRAKADTGK